MGTMSDKPYTEEDAEAERTHLLRLDGDRVTRWTRPDLEPLATRLSRTAEVDACRNMTFAMLEELHSLGPCHVATDVRMGQSCPEPSGGYSMEPLDIAIDFVVLSWKGVFLIWSWPDRYMRDAIPAATRARAEFQQDLGKQWPGRVEAVFHFPREQTGWGHSIGVHEKTDEPFDLVFVGGRIDEVLVDWEPHAGAGIDPQWLRWLSQASEPRWWEVATTRKLPPKPGILTDEQC